MPTQHGLQYGQVSDSVTTNVIEHKAKKMKTNEYFSIFPGLNKLIEENECEYLCNTQQK